MYGYIVSGFNRAVYAHAMYDVVVERALLSCASFLQEACSSSRGGE